MATKFLAKTEYVVYRDRKGRLRKFTPRLKLTAEVRSRKTGKRKRWLAKEPRYFTRKQVALYHTAKKGGFNLKRRDSSGKAVTIFMNRDFASQIPNAFVSEINRIIQMDGEAIWGVSIRASRQSFHVPELRYDQVNPPSFWKDLIRTRVISYLRANMIRTSPKSISKKHGNTYWKKGNFKYYRSIRIELTFRFVP